MRRKCRSRELRVALLEAPATASELAIELGRTKRDVHVGIWVLQTQGHVASSHMVPNLDWPARGIRRRHKLWDLTRLGLAIAKRESAELAEPIRVVGRFDG